MPGFWWVESLLPQSSALSGEPSLYPFLCLPSAASQVVFRIMSALSLLNCGHSSCLAEDCQRVLPPEAQPGQAQANGSQLSTELHRTGELLLLLPAVL
jgi:hypothetical protein